MNIFEKIETAKNIDELADALNEMTTEEAESVDTTSLPTFGGEEPDDTEGIYSWDEDSYLVPWENGWKVVAR